MYIILYCISLLSGVMPSVGILEAILFVSVQKQWQNQGLCPQFVIYSHQVLFALSFLNKNIPQSWTFWVKVSNLCCWSYPFWIIMLDYHHGNLSMLSFLWSQELPELCHWRASRSIQVSLFKTLPLLQALNWELCFICHMHWISILIFSKFMPF